MGFLGKFTLIVALFVGGGNAAWAQKGLPYSYDLESNDLNTEGWDSYNLYNGGSSYNVSQRYNSSSYAHNSSYSFRFYGASNTTQYLISPELETSTTGITFSFYCYAPATSLAQTRTFSVGYSTTATYNSFSNYIDYSITFEKSSTAEWKLITINIDATDAKYVAIKYTLSSTTYFDDFNFVKQTSNKPPKNFILESFEATSATFSWIAGNNETTWQFDYSTDSDFTPGSGINGTSVSITSNPSYTLSGLTTGTTYFASIRADYGNGNYSEWTDKVEFTPRAELETTINDGTGTSSYIPLYGSGANSTLNASQFILPSSQLSSISGRQITKIVFHTTSSYANKDWGVAKWEVYMNEVSTTSFTSTSFMSFGTKVRNSATLSVNNQELSITLDVPYNYSGGNLLIGFKTQTAGTSTWCTFNGISASSGTNNGLYGTSSLSYQSFYPKMTITTIPITTDPVQLGSNGFTTFASPRPLDLANLPEGLKAYKAAVNGDKVRFTEINQAVPANTGILLAGAAGETYSIPVADNGTAVENNDFFVNSTGGTFAAESGYTYYGLIKDSDPLTFGIFDPTSVAIPTNKAYLKVSSSVNSRLMCVFNDATAISEASTAAADATVFDLQGRRVAQPTKGLYIVNGKKVIIK